MTKQYVGTCPVCCNSTELLQLECEHAFCKECLSAQLNARWPGVRIGFAYLNCPLCRAPLAHHEIEEDLNKHRQLHERVANIAKRKYIEDGLNEDLNEVLGRRATERELEMAASESMAVYMCFECSEPYCGGQVNCAVSQEITKEQLKCHECKWASQSATQDHRCYIHGHRFATFKCDFCCSVATWNCGVNHYCDRCHHQIGYDKVYPCPGPDRCPLGVPHPRNLNLRTAGKSVKSFVLGCMGCLGFMEAQDSNDERFHGGVRFGAQNMWEVDSVDLNKYSTADELAEALGENMVRNRLRNRFLPAGENLDVLEGADLLLWYHMGQQLEEDIAADVQWQREAEDANRIECAKLAAAKLAEHAAMRSKVIADELDVQALRANMALAPLDCLEEKAERDRKRRISLKKLRFHREVGTKQCQWRRDRVLDQGFRRNGSRKFQAPDLDEDLFRF